MGSVPGGLAGQLKESLGLRRAVETGTYRGGSASLLAEIFDDVVTIELSEDLHHDAARELAGLGNVKALQGDSRSELGPLAAEGVPTLYWLDGHWSGGSTAGAAHECPVLDELAAIGGGHANDCVLIDDARLFAAAPPPPHDPGQWPTLIEVLDALRLHRPRHHLTMLHDLVIAVPQAARPAVDAFGREPAGEPRARPAPGSQLVAALAAKATRLLRGLRELSARHDLVKR
jgi:hypothetical protein